MFMIKPRITLIIILFLVISCSIKVFPQEDTDNENPVLLVKFIDGMVYISTIGNSTERQAMINEELTIKHILRITDGTECVLEKDNTEIKINGPLHIRVKDIIEAYDIFGKINLRNTMLNRVSELYIETNNKIFSNMLIEDEIVDEERTFKRVIEIKMKGYYERAFTIAYEFIQDYRNTEWRNRRRPDISRFYYILSEIAYETLNLNIAESSMYKTIDETQQNPNAIRILSKDHYRQDVYLLGSMINFVKSNFNMSIDLLDNNINEFGQNLYFQERTGYLTYYMLGLCYMSLNDKEQAKEYMNQALQMSNSAIDKNIQTLKNLYLQERAKEVQVRINQYIIYLNEASLMIGYIKQALSELQ
jgi:tetratricopeptide (TPR) repeat protein